MKTSKIILLLIVIGTLVGQGDVRAQESGQHYIVGIANMWITPGFMEEMAALGYVEGENITYMLLSFEGVEPEQIWDSYWAQIQAMVDAGADWLFLTPYVPYAQEFSQALLAVSETYQIPISYFMFVPVQGYLMGYGPNIDASDRQAARQVDRILRGASPAILPVQTAENYLYVNLEAAETLHMEIPANMSTQQSTVPTV